MGATLQVTIDDREVTALFSNLLARLGNLGPFMEEVGQIVVDDVAVNFQGRHDPEGVPWKPVSAAWAARKKLLGKSPENILILSRMMMSSIHYTAKSDSVTVGTNEPKAATHQFGAPKGSFGTFRRKSRGTGTRGQSWRGGRLPSELRRASWVPDRGNIVALPWGTIPARPFLGISRDAREEILAAGADYLDKGK